MNDRDKVNLWDILRAVENHEISVHEADLRIKEMIAAADEDGYDRGRGSVDYHYMG